MLVWGGEDGTTQVNTGGIYDPATDSWTDITTTGAPSERTTHTAVWTGSRMLVWGGFDDSNTLNTGGIYDPATDSWTDITTTGAPSARRNRSAVWTGSRMLVWGGFDGSTDVNTGGIYDPATDSWAAITTTGAPSARRNHTAVWTGSRMLVWGGFDGLNTLNTGGVYRRGSSSGGGTTNNSLANGTYTFVMAMEDGQMNVVRGTVTFNGDGTGTYNLESPLVESGTFNYTIDANRQITIDDTLVGTITADGSFFAATDTETTIDTEISMIVGVEHSTGLSNSTLNGDGLSGVFFYDTANGISNTTANTLTFDGAGNGAVTEVAPGSGTTNFTYSVQPNGIVNVPSHPDEAGAVSFNGNIAISADAVSSGDNGIYVSMSVPQSSGATDADLSGTYELYQFMDDDVGNAGGAFITARYTVTFNGDGTGSFAQLANSAGDPLDSGPFLYAVDTVTDIGTFGIVGDPSLGMMTPDRSVLAMVDADGGVTVDIKVFVKK
jgi:hypothetical protein